MRPSSLRLALAILLLGWEVCLLGQDEDRRGGAPPIPPPGIVVQRAGEGPAMAFAGGGMPFDMGRGPGQGPITRPHQLNAIDAAHFDIADLFLKKEESDEAVAALKNITTASPDADAVSAAHLSMGNILNEKLGKTDEAMAEYKLVAGRYAEWAERQIIRSFEESGERAKAIDVLADILTRAAAPQDKVRLLNEIAEIYKRDNNVDMAIETLRKIPTVITYEEAMKLRFYYRGPNPMGGVRVQPARPVAGVGGGNVEQPIRPKENPEP